MWPFKPKPEAALSARPLPLSLKGAALALLWLSALPLLLSLPAGVALMVWLIPGATGLLALMRPLNRMVLIALMAVGILVILTLQSGSGDVRGTGLGLMVAILLMKGAEMRTTRDGYSTAGFSLICPFVAFVMEVGGGWTVAVAVASLTGSLILAGMMTEWQDRRTVQRWGTHLRRVAILALMSIPLAAAGFWLIPRLDAPIWGLASGGKSSTGMDNSMSPGDVGNLMKNPSTAFRVDFQGARPDPAQMYWRGMTLGQFDGRAWTTLPTEKLSDERHAVAKHEGGPEWIYTVTMEPTQQRYLFVLDQLVGNVPASTRVSGDNSLQSRRTLGKLVSFQGLTSSPTARLGGDTLGGDARTAMTALPEEFNPRTVAMVDQWQREGLSDSQIIGRTLDLFNREFSYSLSPPLLGRHSVDEFVFETKVGFCEHYSSAFAVIMRAADIPTRVVVGYQGGSENGFGEYWRVRQADAHAWNEVWLDESGWTRVDPTAALDQARVPSEGQDPSFLTRMGSNSDLADWLRQSWGTMFRDFDARQQRNLLERIGLGGLHPAIAMSLATAALLLVFGAIALTLLRERKGRRPAEIRAWQGVLTRLERAGYAPQRHETPLALAERLARQLGDVKLASEMNAAARDFCRWRYQDLDMPGLAARLKALRFPRARSGARP